MYSDGWDDSSELTGGGSHAPRYQLSIQGRQAARIIGRGGANIKRLQTDSGARIKIINTDPNNTRGPSELTITGSLDAVKMARDSVMQTIRDVDEESGQRRQQRRRPEPEPQPEPEPEPEPEYEETPKVIDWNSLEQGLAEWKIKRDARLQPLIKNLYHEHESVRSMNRKEADLWRLENNNISVNFIVSEVKDIQVRGDPSLVDTSVKEKETPDTTPLNPITNFHLAFAEYPELLREIEKQGFTKPSPIQAQAWPILLSGRDMIGIAQTGTGKTLAFLLPALIHVDSQPVPRDERVGPNVLILAPTRELALQIKKEADKYNYKGIKSVCIYGGGSRKDQITEVVAGVQIVIATPGRLNDLVDAQVINVEAFTYLVLDEADRMLDMGFEPQIRRSLLEVRPDKQVVMTSATWPFQVRRLAQSYMVDPVQVVVGTLDLSAVHSVNQNVQFLDEDEKFQELVNFLKYKADDDRVIVFCGKKINAVFVASELALLGINFACFYGGLEQCDRERAVSDMQERVVDILIATDVASRGLDIDNVTHVVNYDFPHTMEEYVHRVGRTGRAGKKGTSITYMTRNDWSKAAELIKILEEAQQEVPDELRDMASRFESMKLRRGNERGRGGGRGRGRGGRNFGCGDFY